VTAPARAKRTYRAADDRREQILDCALEVFSNKGYHGASIADVCARAGIGRATLYQYFDDKRDVLKALADRIARRVTEACSARTRVNIPPGLQVSEADAVRFVERRFRDLLGIVFDDASTVRLLLRAGRGADGVIDQILDQIESVVIGLIEADLAEAQRAGLTRTFDVRFVARFFIGGLEKICLSYVDEDRPIDVAAIARECALLELCGIFLRQPSDTPLTAGAPPPHATPPRTEENDR
jgi:AcrR family transcriptional regulator